MSLSKFVNVLCFVAVVSFTAVVLAATIVDRHSTWREYLFTAFLMAVSTFVGRAVFKS
jgi:hypothetical protein